MVSHHADRFVSYTYIVGLPVSRRILLYWDLGFSEILVLLRTLPVVYGVFEIGDRMLVRDSLRIFMLQTFFTRNDRY